MSRAVMAGIVVSGCVNGWVVVGNSNNRWCGAEAAQGETAWLVRGPGKCKDSKRASIHHIDIHYHVYTCLQKDMHIHILVYLI